MSFIIATIYQATMEEFVKTVSRYTYLGREGKKEI